MDKKEVLFEKKEALFVAKNAVNFVRNSPILVKKQCSAAKSLLGWFFLGK